MTQEQKAEQAWEFQAVERALNDGDYLTGISDFKSSLKREIEKRIEELERELKMYIPEQDDIKAKITECKRFLELLNTV